MTLIVEPTTASCSFSSSKCSSAVVSGRGCLVGPGPGPTPGSGGEVCDCGCTGCVAVRRGDGRDDEDWLTAFWFEGRMLRDGDEEVGIWFVDSRLDEDKTSGDGGTELRSGILMVDGG